MLAIGNCNLGVSCQICIEHVRHLLHLRYLSLSGTIIHRIPEGIGALRFLQTLDLAGSEILEMPPSSSLPTQLVCLRITFDEDSTSGAGVNGLERLTSLEELLIVRMFKWKQLRSLRELKVLTAGISVDNGEESNGDFVESVSHLDKLHHLTLTAVDGRITWEVAEPVLPRQLRHLGVYGIKFLKLPPCVNPSGFPNLCHLDLMLEDMDEQDLRNLGGLQELRFLKLKLKGCSVSISNVNNGNNLVYFPKLRCLKLPDSMVLFVANREDNKNMVSLHLWDGESDIAAVPDELKRPMPPFAASNGGNEEEPIYYGRRSTAAAGPRFMPSLRELHFRVYWQAAWDRGYLQNFRLDYLSTLRGIKVGLWYLYRVGKMEALLKLTADDHPNRPALHILVGGSPGGRGKLLYQGRNGGMHA